MPPQNQTRRIRIEINSSGAKDVEAATKRLGDLNKNVKSLAGGMNILSSAFSGWLGFLGVSQLTRMSDEMQNIGNRLKIITGSTEGAAAAFNQLVGVSDRTNQSISQTGEIYARLAVSLKGAKASTSEVMALTETLINTFRVSGATTAETTNTIIQLSQAFASGELRGQELRSVMEQNATLATLLRERLGPDIYEQAKKGLIGVTTVMRLLAEKQVEINKQAALLAPTFEQVLVKAMNSLQIKIKEVNERFQLSAVFMKAMEFAVGNLGNALAVLAGAMAAATAAMAASLASLWSKMLLFVTANPVVASIAAVVTVIGLGAANFDVLDRAIKKSKATLLDFVAEFRELQLRFREWTGANRTPEAKSAMEETKRQILDARKAARDIRQEIANQTIDKINNAPAAVDPVKEMESLIKKLEGFSGKNTEIKKTKDLIAELNQSLFTKGIGLEEYNRKLNDLNLKKVTESFLTGKKTAIEFADALKTLEIERLNRELAIGAIGYSDYKKAVEDLDLSLLNEKMQAGLITMKEYNNELLKMETKFSATSPFKTGITNYMESVGTLAENIAKGVEKTFGALEEGLVQFVKTGKINFRDFANAVIDEIIRIQVRMALAGLISSIIGGATTATAGATGGSTSSSFGNNYNLDMPAAPSFATGGVMTSSGAMPLHSYASGGIARSPQMALFGEGRMPEAYVPLPNGKSIPVEMSGGSNSVTVMVNVNQNGDSDITSNTTFGNRLGQAIQNAVRQELAMQRRPGGQLT